MGIRIVLVAVLAALRAGAALADFDSGCAAFDRGDHRIARREWEALAGEGHAHAHLRLGCLYTIGHSVAADPALALRLYRLSAEQGDPGAQNNLGGMYAEGLGVTPDLVEAYMWFELAAGAGHAMAQKNRAYLEDRMSAAQIAAAVERARTWRTAHP